MKTLLIEIGCEDLPAGSIRKLAQHLRDQLLARLNDQGIQSAEAKTYATPRRIACKISAVSSQTPARDSERRGPALAAAFDSEGRPSKAALGFAASCGVEISELETLETDKGQWLLHRSVEPGRSLAALLTEVLPAIVDSMPLPKKMRWSDHDYAFLRPLRWLVAMHGEQVIPIELMGVQASNISYGHRFHKPEAITISEVDDYREILSGAFVIADFEARRKAIVVATEACAKKLGLSAKMDSALVDEITGLVEWPVAVSGSFDPAFLQVPKEALIQTMQDNQRYFPLFNSDGQLHNGFITIANIESLDVEQVRSGNERVIAPRLADAKFFWDQDRKLPLAHHLEGLRKVVYQEKLGSLYDKTERLVRLSRQIAKDLQIEASLVERAAWMSKCDLLSEMVYEFPDLQGIAGKYYLHGEGESMAVAEALEQQYWPKTAGAAIATGPVAQCLAIAEKIDTLAAIFAIGQKPTGTKDPFALRRNALGLLRTIVEAGLDLDIAQLINEAKSTLAAKLGDVSGADDAVNYIMERSHAYYAEQNIHKSVVDAVLAKAPTRPLDIDARIQAVAAFAANPDAQSLAAANKRAGNILKKNANALQAGEIDTALLSDAAEVALKQALDDVEAKLAQAGDYTAQLQALSTLKTPVDAFFNDVMVMAEDPAIKINRLKLVAQVYASCNGVAELAML